MSLAKLALILVIGFSAQSANAAPHGIYQTKKMQFLKTPSRGNLRYFGGPVISNVKAVAVLWGANVKGETKQNIGGFLSAMVNSTYMDWLKEYNTNIKAVDGRDGTNQSIGRGSFVGTIAISPTHTSNQLSDKDIQDEIEVQIAKGVLPKADDNTIYMTYFPPGVSITIEGMKSCESFCAYHEGFNSQQNGNVFYGVMPDLGGSCSWSCGNSFNSLSSISSHELLEAVTDPFPTPADKPAYPQAWNDDSGNEIADLCSGAGTAVLHAPKRDYVVQKEFDNATSSCASGPYQAN